MQKGQFSVSSCSGVKSDTFHCKISLRAKGSHRSRELNNSACIFPEKVPATSLCPSSLDTPPFRLSASIQKYSLKRCNNTMGGLQQSKPPEQIKPISSINTAQYMQKTLSTTPSYAGNPFPGFTHKPNCKGQLPTDLQSMGHSMQIRNIIGQRKKAEVVVGDRLQTENSHHSIQSTNTFTPISIDS